MPRERVMYGRRPWWLSVLGKTNLTVIGITFACNVYTFSGGAVYFTIGAIACTLTVKVLKLAIKQPRPLHPHSMRKKTYGMPSTHSANIAYYMVYTILASCYLPLHESLPQSLMTRLLPPIIVVPWAVTVMSSRVWLGHHTWPQVIVGASYGLSWALFWFTLYKNGADEYAQLLEAHVLLPLRSRVNLI